jgi:hypothetical protein
VGVFDVSDVLEVHAASSFTAQKCKFYIFTGTKIPYKLSRVEADSDKASIPLRVVEGDESETECLQV